jgi:S-methylmethionine-dependent homocysteine/selenocysteine methylase
MMQGSHLPQLGGSVFLTDGGVETDLIFHRGVDLPEFASFVLHEDAAGEAVLRSYYDEYLDIASKGSFGLVLETTTWRASKDWGSKVGYDTAQLRAVNERSVSFFQELRRSNADGTVVISGCVGPRGDAYTDMGPASADEALSYHLPQVEVLAGSGVDLVSALTLTNVAEAIGFVRAAQARSIPAVVSFTVETDGRLPSGMSLSDAITAVDEATDASTIYFMINCAHPDHFSPVLDGHEPALTRVRGVRANASRLSHAELDEATVLDDGNAHEFGTQMVTIHGGRPQINILGGCCGTDARHITAIAHSYMAAEERPAD